MFSINSSILSSFMGQVEHEIEMVDETALLMNNSGKFNASEVSMLSLTLINNLTANAEFMNYLSKYGVTSLSPFVNYDFSSENITIAARIE